MALHTSFLPLSAILGFVKLYARFGDLFFRGQNAQIYLKRHCFPQ